MQAMLGFHCRLLLTASRVTPPLATLGRSPRNRRPEAGKAEVRGIGVERGGHRTTGANQPTVFAGSELIATLMVAARSERGRVQR